MLAIVVVSRRGRGIQGLFPHRYMFQWIWMGYCRTLTRTEFFHVYFTKIRVNQQVVGSNPARIPLVVVRTNAALSCPQLAPTHVLIVLL